MVAPYPVTLSKGQAHITAPAGATYQVLVDGVRIVPVTSKGSDVLELTAKP